MDRTKKIKDLRKWFSDTWELKFCGFLCVLCMVWMYDDVANLMVCIFYQFIIFNKSDFVRSLSVHLCPPHFTLSRFTTFALLIKYSPLNSTNSKSQIDTNYWVSNSKRNDRIYAKFRTVIERCRKITIRARNETVTKQELEVAFSSRVTQLRGKKANVCELFSAGFFLFIRRSLFMFRRIHFMYC